jgi:hypothetical protein
MVQNVIQRKVLETTDYLEYVLIFLAELELSFCGILETFIKVSFKVILADLSEIVEKSLENAFHILITFFGESKL